LDNVMKKFQGAMQYANPDLEAGLISAVVNDYSLYWELKAYLPAEAFTKHAAYWKELVKTIENKKPIPVRLLRAFPQGTKVEPVADPLETAKELRELYQRRLLAVFYAEGLEKLRDKNPVPEIVSTNEKAIARIQGTITAGPGSQLICATSMIDEVLKRAEANIASRKAGKLTLGIPTKIPKLDDVLNGLQMATTYILAGGPAVGKTSLALQWACEAAESCPVIYLTFENSPFNLTQKAICRLGNISSKEVDHGRADIEKLKEGMNSFKTISDNIDFLEGNRDTNTAYILGKALEAMNRHKAKNTLVIIDYMQEMAYSEDYNTLKEKVSYLAQNLKNISRRLNSPVLAICSLSRGLNGLNYTDPNLSSLKESGDIEYAADVVILLGKYKDKVTDPGCEPLFLRIGKNRYGETGVDIPLVFKPAYGHFREEAL